MVNRLVPKTLKLSLIGMIFVSILSCVSKPKQIKRYNWETTFRGKEGVIAMMPGGCVFLGIPKETDGGISVFIRDPYYEKTNCRIIAVDNQGNIHTCAQSSRLVLEKGYRQTDAVFPGLTLEEIKEFQLQTQLCDQKTKNVEP